jgi:hypothetical protein
VAAALAHIEPWRPKEARVVGLIKKMLR